MPQRIESVALTHLWLPPQPSHGEGVPPLRDLILVALATDGGYLGVGECAPASSADHEVVGRCWDELASALGPLLLGRTVASVDEFEALFPRDRSLHPSARAGAETAAWDLVGQRQGLSLAKMLGASSARIGAGVEPSVVLAHEGTVVDLLRAIEPYRAEGVRSFVLEIAPGGDLDRLSAARTHFPDCQWAADARGRYARRDLDLWRRIDDLDLLWIDDPLSPDDLDGLVALQNEIVTPVCLEATCSAALRRGACRLARLSIQRAGGLGAAKRLHDLCAAHGVGCRVVTGSESEIGRAQAIALATLPNCKDPAGLAPSVNRYSERIIKPRIELDEAMAGRFRVATRPGLGHLLDPVALRAHQVRRVELTA